MRILTTLVVAGALVLALAGCGAWGFPGVYRLNIEQGNIVTQEMVDQLKPGMSRRQVRYILGTPLIEDSFNRDRWDYIYLVRNGYDTRAENRLTVFFDGHSDPPGVARRQFDDLVAELLLAAAEQLIVLGEVCVAQHMCRHQGVLLHAIVSGQVRAARVTGKYDLEQA